MTQVVTIQASGDLTRIRRYDKQPGERVMLTHEGFYRPETVLPHHVTYYLDHPPPKDWCAKIVDRRGRAHRA